MTLEMTEEKAYYLEKGVAPIKPEFIRERRHDSFSLKENDGSSANVDGKNACIEIPTEKEEGSNQSSFKKRPRDEFVPTMDRLCRALAASEGCPFGDACKFSHDIATFLEKKGEDLGEKCPVYEAFGYCKYGVNCRFALAHFDVETKTNAPIPEGGPRDSGEMNELPKNVQANLRKRTHPFLTMHDKRAKKLSEKDLVQDLEKRLGVHCESPLLSEKKIIDFRGKIYVAPLTTVGNLPFRRIMKDFKADITCGEMALASNLLQGQASEWALLRRHKSEDIFGVQIAGGFSDQMSRTMELVSKEISCDFIDINMGCPIDLVCNSGAGSTLMQRPKRLEEVVRAALTGIELGSIGKSFIPALTVKLRTGWDHKQPNAHELIPMIQKCRAGTAFMNPCIVNKYTLKADLKVEALTIHGRSRLMRYTKLADWDYIRTSSDERDVEMGHMAILGNGDVLSFEEFHEHLSSGQLDSCMLARGALIKPWLPTEIKERRHWDISASERLDIMKDFVKYGLEHWGSDQMGVNKTRRFLLEWLSFLCRYIPVGLLERLPQKINDRPPTYVGRNDLETLLGSDQAVDWIRISEMLLGPVPEGFKFTPKHKANAYSTNQN